MQSFGNISLTSTKARLHRFKPSSFSPNKAIVINVNSVEPSTGEGNHSVINIYNKIRDLCSTCFSNIYTEILSTKSSPTIDSVTI
jgi:hypothetical protein